MLLLFRFFRGCVKPLDFANKRSHLHRVEALCKRFGQCLGTNRGRIKLGSQCSDTFLQRDPDIALERLEGWWYNTFLLLVRRHLLLEQFH